MKTKIKSLFITLVLLTGLGISHLAVSLECASDCSAWDDCSIKIDCSELCVEHRNSFECGSTTYNCAESCEGPVVAGA